MDAIQARCEAEADAMDSTGTSGFSNDLRDQIPRSPHMATGATPQTPTQNIDLNFSAFEKKADVLATLFDGFNIG